MHAFYLLALAGLFATALEFVSLELIWNQRRK
jgi:hypothetical protein